MKITKEQLKQVIAEELGSLMQEQEYDFLGRTGADIPEYTSAATPSAKSYLPPRQRKLVDLGLASPEDFRPKTYSGLEGPTRMGPNPLAGPTAAPAPPRSSAPGARPHPLSGPTAAPAPPRSSAPAARPHPLAGKTRVGPAPSSYDTLAGPTRVGPAPTAPRASLGSRVGSAAKSAAKGALKRGLNPATIAGDVVGSAVAPYVLSPLTYVPGVGEEGGLTPPEVSARYQQGSRALGQAAGKAYNLATSYIPGTEANQRAKSSANIDRMLRGAQMGQQAMRESTISRDLIKKIIIEEFENIKGNI